MIICETSEQARKLYAFFDEIQNELNTTVSEPSRFKAGLILHDSDDKETRKNLVKNFKKNMTIDILIVFIHKHNRVAVCIYNSIPLGQGLHPTFKTHFQYGLCSLI